MIERPEDRIVLESGGDSVVSLFKHSEDYQIQSVSRVVRKAEAVWVCALKEIGEHPSCCLNH